MYAVSIIILTVLTETRQAYRVVAVSLRDPKARYAVFDPSSTSGGTAPMTRQDERSRLAYQ